MDSLAMDSQLGIGLAFLEVGDESGGVTGALFEIRRGGRDEGMAFRSKGMRKDELLASLRDGLGKEEEDGLTWYDGIGLGNDEDSGLGFWEEYGVILVEVPTISIGGGLHPCTNSKGRYIISS